MKTYKTKDIYLAAALLAFEFPIKNVSNEENRTFFHFGIEREPFIGGDNWTIDKAVKAYWDKSVPIAPLILFNSFKELKNRIFNQ